MHEKLGGAQGNAKEPISVHPGRHDGGEVRRAPAVGVRQGVLSLLRDSGHFINRLRPDIRAEKRVLRPTGLEQMMDLAQRIEERNLVLRENAAGTTSSRGQSALLSLSNYQRGGPQSHAQPTSK